MINNEIKFSYRVDTIGITTIGEFEEVICEIRYYFIGSIGNENKERYYVQKIDTSNLNKNTFKNSVDVSRDKLLEWLIGSIDPANLEDMKNAIHEQFHPKVQYVSPLYFREKCGL